MLSGCMIFMHASCARKDPTTTAGVLTRAAAVVERVAKAVAEVETAADVPDVTPTLEKAADELNSLAAIAKRLPVPDAAEKEAIGKANDRMKAAIERLNANFEHIKADHAEARYALAEAMLPFQLALVELNFDVDPMFKVMKQATPPAGLTGPPPVGPPSMPSPPNMQGPPPDAFIPFPQRLANFKNRHGAERVVTVEVTGLADSVDIAALASELRAVAACGNNTSSKQNGAVIVALAPVSDLEAFAAALNWGDKSLDEATRTIRVTVNPDLLPETLRPKP